MDRTRRDAVPSAGVPWYAERRSPRQANKQARSFGPFPSRKVDASVCLCAKEKIRLILSASTVNRVQ